MPEKPGGGSGSKSLTNKEHLMPQRVTWAESAESARGPR
jgi:hypothetical protein